MKLLIIATIVALLSVGNVHLQNVDQLRQCSCDEQYTGFREWKNYITQCFDQCRITTHPLLLTMLDNPVKIYSCLDFKTDVVHRLFDCVNGKLFHEDSCVSGTQAQVQKQTLETQVQNQTLETRVQNQTLENEDFSQMIIRNIEPFVDGIHSALEHLGQDYMRQYGNFLLGFGKCARSCLFDNSNVSAYWEQLRCIPKVTENTIQQHVQSCYRDVDIKNTIYKICTCSAGVGVSNLQQHCNQLRSVRFPQWAEEDVSNGMLRNSLLDIIGDQQMPKQLFQKQFPQQFVSPQSLFVKLEIQQEEPDFQNFQRSIGFDQGYSRGQNFQGEYRGLGYQGFTDQEQIGEFGRQGQTNVFGRQGSFGNEGIREQTGEFGRQVQTGELGRQGQAGVLGRQRQTDGLGRQGQMGEFGRQGQNNELGRQKQTGEFDRRGQTGEFGRQGQTGEFSRQGQTGEFGSQGQTGEFGRQGQTGEFGRQGQNDEFDRQGQTKMLGRQEQTGDFGKQAQTGEFGRQGQTGEFGRQGQTGVLGRQSQIGEPGRQEQTDDFGRQGPIRSQGQGTEGQVGGLGTQGLQGQIGGLSNQGQDIDTRRGNQKYIGGLSNQGSIRGQGSNGFKKNQLQSDQEERSFL